MALLDCSTAVLFIMVSSLWSLTEFFSWFLSNFSISASNFLAAIREVFELVLVHNARSNDKYASSSTNERIDRYLGQTVVNQY